MTSYYRSGLFSFGMLLFCISQILRFIQLFRDAAARKEANQAPPENFTAAGITWGALVIVAVALICLLLYRNRKGILRMARTRAHFLLSTLIALWGLYYCVTLILEMIRNAELTLLFDIGAIAAGVIAPVVLLQLADTLEELANDVALLLCSIGGVALSIISLVVLFILRKGYANAQLLLVTEFMFRAAMALCSLAALLKAVKLRGSFPVTVETPPEKKREPVRERAPRPARRTREAEDEPFTLHLEGELEARPVRESPGVKAQRHVDSLLSYAKQDFEDEPKPRSMRSAQENTIGSSRAIQPPSWDTGRIIVQGGTGRIRTQDPGTVPSERQTCPYCGKRMPVGFPNCPRCGRDM